MDVPERIQVLVVYFLVSYGDEVLLTICSLVHVARLFNYVSEFCLPN